MNSINDENEYCRTTAKELKKIEGFENISEELAEKVIAFLVQLAKIEYEIKLNGNNK
jgi:hypothetical protein